MRITALAPWRKIAPLQVGDLAWVVVLRNVTLPILGPPGGSYQATLGVLIETTRPRWVFGLTVAPNP